MRHLVLALMIALLPIRGWVGDAMAAQMLADRMEAAAVQALPVQAQPGDAQAAHEECPGHAAQAQAPDAQPQPPATHEACASCVTCQVCSSAALAVSRLEAQAHPIPHARPDAGSAAFASAEAVPVLKPPIS